MPPIGSLEDSVEFFSNPEPRCPCVLLLDVSDSMRGQPLAELNAGLQAFRDQLMRDPVAAKRVDVCVITFGTTVKVVQEFIPINRFVPPTLTPQGYTHMGAGILQALQLLQSYKKALRELEIDYFRPHVFMITDGEPKDEPEHVLEWARTQLESEEKSKGVLFFAIAVQGADIPRLRKLVVREPIDLKGHSFQEMIDYLSKSVSALSQSRFAEDAQRPMPLPGTQ